MSASGPATTPDRPRRRVLATVLALLATVAVAGAAVAAPTTDDQLLKDEKHRLAQANTTYDSGTKSGSAWNMAQVGHNDLGGRGFNGDVAVYKKFAYIGHWGFADSATGNSRFCPAQPLNGVAVVDTTTPSAPVRVATLQNPDGTSAEDINVFTARYGPYAGRDIAAVGIQVCGGSRSDMGFFRGVQLFDVTNPLAPKEIGRLNTGCCTRGLHETDVQHRTDLKRTFLYASVPASEYPDPDTTSGVRDELGRGDFRLIDITDPSKPFAVSDWGIVGDTLADDTLPAAGIGCDPDPIYGHSVSPSEDGKLAFVAYWDSGFIALDLTNPAKPVYKGRTVYPADADGDGHSSTYDAGRKLLFTADEDFCKATAGAERGFGYLRVYDAAKLASPQQIGSYRTPNSSGTRDIAAGDYTIHLTELVGTTLYASWYSDGLRVLDVTDARHPVEVANFVPPAGNNPVKPSQRNTLTNTTQVWGVAVDEARDLVFLSDMNTGLWIVKRTDVAAGRG